MSAVFGVLAAAAGLYSLLILIRIILSWFGRSVESKPVELVNRITDPYLNWWRRHLNFRIGALDFSAVAGIAALSVLQNILYRISYFKKISAGVILAIIVSAVWSIISFILIFFIIIIVLRLIGYLANSDIYSPLWQMVDSVSRLVLYRLNRIMFGKRITGFIKGIVMSLILLAVILTAGYIGVPRLTALLSNLPV